MTSPSLTQKHAQALRFWIRTTDAVNLVHIDDFTPTQKRRRCDTTTVWEWWKIKGNAGRQMQSAVGYAESSGKSISMWRTCFAQLSEPQKSICQHVATKCTCLGNSVFVNSSFTTKALKPHLTECPSLQGCYAISTGEHLQNFRKSALPPSSGFNSPKKYVYLSVKEVWILNT
jgi:hypothetical protein